MPHRDAETAFSKTLGGMPWRWDLSSGALFHFDLPAIALWIHPSLEKFLAPLRDEVGADLFRLLVTYSSSMGAKEDHEAIVKNGHPSFIDGFNSWSDAVASAGWGRFSLTHFDKETLTATVRVQDPWELKLVGLDGPQSCPFLLGKVVGLFNCEFETNCWAFEQILQDSDETIVEFSVAPSKRTIELEIAALRSVRREAREQALAHEVSSKTSALSAAQEQRESMLASISDLVITIDTQERIESYLLPPDSSTYFPPVEQSIGRSVIEVFGPSLVDLVERCDALYPVACSTRFELSVGASIEYFDARASARRSAQGQCSGATLVVRNISEHQKMENALEQRKRIESIGRLAGGIAHDFNNMLAVIVSATELLKLESEESTSIYIDSILEAAGSAAGLVKNMQALADDGKRHANVVSVHDAIEKSVRLLQRSIDRRIKCQADFGASPEFVLGDDTQLESALLNLGLNARDAMPNGGEIRFRTRSRRFNKSFSLEPHGRELPEGEYIEVSVQDTGEGMSPETLEKIFDPFFTTKPDGAGLGLGLAGVQRTIERHGGALSATSDLSIGTTFVALLPTEKGLTPDRPDSVKPGATSNDGGGLILVVDDDPMLRDLGQLLLEKMGYEVMLAAHGVEALECQSRCGDRLSLVILDLNMPVMNGAQALELLRKKDPHLPVIITTGFATSEEMPSGDFQVLKKPFRVAELESEIELALRNRIL